MKLFGKEIASGNISRLVAILVIAVIWRTIVGDDFYSGPKNPYVFPVMGFCFISILLGELTRKIFRIFVKEKNTDVAKSSDSEELEGRRDIDTLNFSLLWTVIFILITVL